MDKRELWIKSYAGKNGLDAKHIKNCAELLDDGGTIPFIARYRKELTGSMDEVQITELQEGLNQHIELEKRRDYILEVLDGQGVKDAHILNNIRSAENMQLLEDLYLPHKPKRRTRAQVARERGLEPLARALFQGRDYLKEAKKYIGSHENLANLDDVLTGARDIVSEMISENPSIRKSLRQFFRQESVVSSKLIPKKREEADKFSDYFDFQEPVKRIAGHRFFALMRGEGLKLLRVSLRPDPIKAVGIIRKQIKSYRESNHDLLLAIEDCYTRLLAPSLENELRAELKKSFDHEAIEVFSANLSELLLAPPLGQKRVMALDPGYRTGAKLVCLDEQGGLLHNETIYPTRGSKDEKRAGEAVRKLVQSQNIDAIGVGDGTAGRETEKFIRNLDLKEEILITLVNEDGASIYSASESARKEFPDEDITVRGAVSIGRRLQDPLAELVKIDPKSIGVGQYQHDVNQAELKKSLEDVVTRCVNRVGVEVNSASVELLSFVAGLGRGIAENIILHRKQNGPFSKRQELLKVKRLGPKAYEQCAGFLRVANSKNILDCSGVHPERYTLVEQMAKDHGVGVSDLLNNEAVRKSIRLENYLTNNVGMETLSDIMEELAQPGRDPRPAFSSFMFDETIQKIEDLRENMILPAIITNVTKFGAFADIGLKQDGLIHISRMADRFVKDPGEIVSVRQQVKVRVVEIDSRRNRIGLSLLL